MMKKILILSLAALVLTGCNNSAQQPPANVNQSNLRSNDLPVVSSHSNVAEKNSPLQSSQTGSTESPMAKPVDVVEMTADIERAEKEYQKNQKDEKAKSELAKAYFVRATALTGAAQYRAALGDYRKGLKLNPTDEDARKMHDQILSILKSLGREPPKEGEEPSPLPVKN
jgi:tetratricopeptide (TPR) repeat protein